ncbi:probable ubiquitin-conjugating enzyme E2 26 isoform X4 [Diospyros lotus]|uniref:probable ubiquitin-conjugating enzyme E2 26 isoform X1 n=1 Tax=Diospyros lotus TaxID=55363 RepID=UPI002256D756|nr:probable ubiquitin-conjugating enzyme E2 26 isoform X1 [Diospyros lotus]XP_052178152.1 probable ubiquitin-conjugating enzyme E2 26 isoform X4 [Diospyros lotus]
MESPPSLARYMPHQSKKRVFPGSSSSYVEPDVVEISPPGSWTTKPKSLKQKEVIHPEVINVDIEEDSGDVIFIDRKVDAHSRGKEALADFACSHINTAKAKSHDGVQSSKKSSILGLHSSFNLEGFSNDFPYDGDEYMDTYHDDLTHDSEYEYAILQAHFDSMDIPPGVEVPIPWFSGPAQTENNLATINTSNHSAFAIPLDASGADLPYSHRGLELTQTGNKSISTSTSSLQTHVDAFGHPYRADLSSPWQHPEFAQDKKKIAGSTSSKFLSSQMEKGAHNQPTEYKSWRALGFSNGKKKPSGSGSTTGHSSHNLLGTVKPPSGKEPSYSGSYLHRCKKPVDNGSPNYSKVSAIQKKLSATQKVNLPSGVDAYMSGWPNSALFMPEPYLINDVYNSPDPLLPFIPKELPVSWVQDPANGQKSVTSAGSLTVPSSSPFVIPKYVDENEIMQKFELFKQFDMVQDHSDHHYSCKGSSTKQPSKSWAKKIQEEWRILEKDLPDTIFVRVYESRMDLLTAVIIGAEGTPYHDGLFFFDVFFPSGYPNVPPHVHYHSGGLRINPNLYNCGKVCLSLLNTWSGSQNEKWIPGVSTMLQVLVSIQGLILNAKPYFNEPGFARMSGSANGEKNSQQYNENTLILSLKTMVYTMRRPPKHFEDFVFGHFYKRAQDILVACKAYKDGAQVGCLAKGGVQDLDAGDKSCSQHFKDTLADYITVLVQTFSQIGAKDCEKFLSLAEKGNGRAPSVPKAPNYFDPLD